MLFHLAYRTLTTDDLEGHNDVTKFKKNIFYLGHKTLHYGSLKVSYKKLGSIGALLVI